MGQRVKVAREKLIMGKSREELEKEIIQFLDEGSTKMGDVNAKCALKHGIACVLATSRNNIPRATPVDFFNEGLSIWIIILSCMYQR